jgi:hypothetical protein
MTKADKSHDIIDVCRRRSLVAFVDLVSLGASFWDGSTQTNERPSVCPSFAGLSGTTELRPKPGPTKKGGERFILV